jgi:hypothetical protein
VQVIGEPWENSAYYELAEQLVHMLLFWDNNIVESAAIDWGDAVSVDRVSLLRKP